MKASTKKYLAGKEGEDKVYDILKGKSELTVIPNLTYGFDSSLQYSSHQIDFVVLSKKNVFLIEVKNFNHILEADFDKETWVLEYHKTGFKDRRRNGIDNPIFQNKIHRASFLRKMPFLDPDHVFAVTILVKNENGLLMEYKWRDLSPSDFIVRKDFLLEFMEWCDEESEEWIDVDAAVKVIRQLPEVAGWQHRKYCENVKAVRKIISNNKKYPTFEQIQFRKKSCAKCNNKMYVRHSDKSLFWGCSDYPNCTCTDNKF